MSPTLSSVGSQSQSPNGHVKDGRLSESLDIEGLRKGRVTAHVPVAEAATRTQQRLRRRVWVLGSRAHNNDLIE